MRHFRHRDNLQNRANKVCAWRHIMPPPLSSPVGAQAPARRRADAT